MDLQKLHGKKISITIPAELPLSPKVREFVTSFLKQESKFSNIWIWRLALMADEMVNNAIEHWSNGEEDSVSISIISFEDNGIQITVKDMWKIWSTFTAEKLTEQIRENMHNNKNWIKLKTWIRGRGLSHIVGVLSDDFTYEDNENGWLTWTINKNFNAECAADEENSISKNENKINVKTFTL